MNQSDKAKNILLDKTCDKCRYAMYTCNDFSTTCEKWEPIVYGTCSAYLNKQYTKDFKKNDI